MVAGVKVAALYVATGGCYFGLPDVVPYDIHRDARKYDGPWPVVAHPPCERWGYFYAGSPLTIARTGQRKKLGDDGGCFALALEAVRMYGGVLEHPHGSQAWKAFGLSRPDRWGGWTAADLWGGWTCCVDQGHYGHRAKKATWLYASGIELPALIWGRSRASVRLDPGYHSAEERRRLARYDGAIERLSKSERAATPLPFRDLLLSMARSVRTREAA